MRAVANNQESSNLVGIRVGASSSSAGVWPPRSPCWPPPCWRRRWPHRHPDARPVPAGLGGRRARRARLARRRRGRRTHHRPRQSAPRRLRTSIGSIDLRPDMLYPVMLVILLGVLLFRPAGLFGTEKVERV